MEWPAPATIMENASVKRYQIYLDTGYYPSYEYSKTWDMLAYLKALNESTK